jgi:DNA-binding response OmpR family regulator
MSDRRKILIIDDEIDLCLLLKDYFVRKNYEVTVTHTLEEGKDLLYKTKPGILFLDNNLPDGTGWNNAHQFAADLPETYIILISAFHPSKPVMPETAKYRTIEKPISFSDLDKQFAEL